MPVSVIPVTGALEQPVGAISQTDFPLISPRLVETTDTLNINFGDPFVLNPDNTYSSVASFISKNSVAAFIALMQDNQPLYPLGIAKDTVEANAYFPLSGGTNMPAGYYAPGMICNGLTRGTINIAINNGTPSGAGVPVYIRTTLNGAIPNGVVGGFEAVNDGVTPVGTAFAGNVGNATIGTLSNLPFAITGTYLVDFFTATSFLVFDPMGRFLGVGTTGVAFNAGNQIQFTITAGGTAMTRSDGFSIVAAMKTILIENMVFKTGLLSTDPVTAQVTAQATILERKVA